jgi:hypothetical protein
MIRSQTDLNEPQLVVEEVTDPAQVVRSQVQFERFRANSAWLQSHWNDVLPQARGKFLAVAGQAAFIADTAEEAWAKAKASHPEDDGAFSQYVLPQSGPRIYAHSWRVVDLR